MNVGGSPMIAVVGASECDEALAGLARDVGRLLGERGAMVVTGGRGGVMEAACRGVHEAGGMSIGILPGTDRSGANAFVRVAIATGLGEARNAIIAQTCDAMIGVGGEFGTLSEMALARKMDKRVVSLRSWAVDGSILVASTAEEAVGLAMADGP